MTKHFCDACEKGLIEFLLKFTGECSRDDVSDGSNPYQMSVAQLKGSYDFCNLTCFMEFLKKKGFK